MFRFVEHVGALVVDALSPVWTAWKRLTGRRTVDLGFILLVGYFVARVHQGSYLFPPIISVFFGFNLYIVRSRQHDGELLDPHVAWSQEYLRTMVGISLLGTLCLDLPGIVVAHRNATEPLTYVLAWLAAAAGAADDDTGGKTIWREALERLRSLLPTPLPSPA